VCIPRRHTFFRSLVLEIHLYHLEPKRLPQTVAHIFKIVVIRIGLNVSFFPSFCVCAFSKFKTDLFLDQSHTLVWPRHLNMFTYKCMYEYAYTYTIEEFLMLT